jgi:hypothetical protein
VGVTVPVRNGIGDSSHFNVYVMAVALMFNWTTSPLPAPPRKVELPISAVAGQSDADVPEAGGPCTPQLAPEHCGALTAPGSPALPPPHAMSNGAVANANVRPRVMACAMLLSPFL